MMQYLLSWLVMTSLSQLPCQLKKNLKNAYFSSAWERHPENEQNP